MPADQAFSTRETGNALVVTAFTDSSQTRYTDFRHDVNRVVAQVREIRPPRVVINLGQVPLMTSVAIGAIVKIARESRAMGADVCLCNASQNVLEVLETMHLTNLWPHFATIELAVSVDPNPQEAGE